MLQMGKYIKGPLASFAFAFYQELPFGTPVDVKDSWRNLLSKKERWGKSQEFWLKSKVDRLEEELMNEQEKLKGITEEMERTFAELSGY